MRPQNYQRRQYRAISAPLPKIGAPNDRYEREADAMADRILQTPRRFSGQVLSAGPASLQRKCAACQHEEEQIRRQPMMGPASSGGAAQATPALQSQLRNSRGSGQALPSATQSFMSQAFNTDFNHVRIHTDQRAVRMSQGLHARAFTYGSDIYFNRGQYRPQSRQGKHLLGHELTHVVQQQQTPKAYIARAPLDLDKLHSELYSRQPLTATSGEIGFGADAGPSHKSPAEDSSLPIKAEVFPRNTGLYDQSPTEKRNRALQTSNTAPPLQPTITPETLKDAQKRKVESGPPGYMLHPGGLLVRPKRALVISGIHGNERGALDLVKTLRSELADAKNPLARDFDTLLIPAMNPGGIVDRKRHNRRDVDLNRNFPGIKGFPSSKANLPLQPETKAVMTAIKKFKPDRILSLHGISDTDHGGVFADPVEGQARELACRMAVLSLGELDKGKWSAEINVRGNRVAKGVCEARYPGSPPKIFKEHTSLGSYASQDKALGGLGTMVITHEVAGKGHLADKGKGRSLETLMPGIREFLLDHENERSVADDLLRSHVDKDFLQGNSGGKSLASKNIKLAVADRFEDMNTYYKKVWRPKAPDKKSLPRALKIVSSYRSFKDQARIVKGQLKKQKITTKSTEAEIKKALLDILTTRSMPGFSRHHWGTEIDVQSAKRSDWIKGGRYEPLIPFLREEARKFGFFHPYSQAYPAQGIAGFPDASLPHYQEEPWHLSYAPIANVVQEEWAKQFQGKELEKLIEETAKAIASSKKNKQHIEDIKKALKSIGIANFQTNVSPAP